MSGSTVRGLVKGGEKLVEARAAATTGTRLVRHHTVPVEILKSYLPADIANAPLVRGIRSAPNRWPIPEDLHLAIHSGPGGGPYNTWWRAKVDEAVRGGRRPTVEMVREWRQEAVEVFGLTEYRP